jgi:hypothetical protein
MLPSGLFETDPPMHGIPFTVTVDGPTDATTKLVSEGNVNRSMSMLSYSSAVNVMAYSAGLPAAVGVGRTTQNMYPSTSAGITAPITNAAARTAHALLRNHTLLVMLTPSLDGTSRYDALG